MAEAMIQITGQPAVVSAIGAQKKVAVPAGREKIRIALRLTSFAQGKTPFRSFDAEGG